MSSNEIEDAMSEQFNPGLDPDDPAVERLRKAVWAAIEAARAQGLPDRVISLWVSLTSEEFDPEPWKEMNHDQRN